jgi:tetratricopeptide (TPR) repeat protein
MNRIRLVARAISALRENDLAIARPLCARLISEFGRSIESLQLNGEFHLKLGSFGPAAQFFREAISLEPRNLENYLGFAAALRGLGANDLAFKVLEEAIPRFPVDMSLRLAIAKMGFESGSFKFAQRHLEFAEKCGTLDEHSLILMARILVLLDCAEDAKRYLIRAIGGRGNREARNLLGYLLQSQGDFESARAQFWESIQSDPRSASGYHGFAQGRKFVEGDRPLLDQIEAQLNSGEVSLADRQVFSYVAGKGYEDFGEWEKAFRNYAQANKIALSLNLEGRAFDRHAHERFLRETESHFNSDRLSQGLPTDSHRAPIPIFVVGVMRSGTSLVEQILSSHPGVSGGGEIEFWPNHHRAAFEPNALPQLRKDYSDLIRSRYPGSGYVVDKMPQNYQSLGAIHLAFPESPIIHVRRHPIDTCLSIFTTAYSISPDFAHDLGSIGAMYEEYLRIMEYWRDHLPSGRLIEIDYEDLVDDPEPLLRDLCGRVGLSWDEGLLCHEKNPRQVVTPSAWQVRQPIYQTSRNRWHRFEPWLGPLRGLADLPPSGKLAP